MTHVTRTTRDTCRGSIYRLLAADVVSGDTKLTHVAKLVNMASLHRMASGGAGGSGSGSAGAGTGAGAGAGTGAGAGAASVTAPQVDPHLPPLLIITIMLPLYPVRVRVCVWVLQDKGRARGVLGCW